MIRQMTDIVKSESSFTNQVLFCQINYRLAVVIGIGSLGLSLSKVVVHLSFHHLLDSAAEQVFESLLNVLSSLDVVFL